MHIYAFGSICRGDVSVDSDVDLLALVEGYDDRFDPNKFSIYSYKRICELWSMGNAFAWHLHLESRLLFAGDGSNYLANLGSPARYVHAATDCERFKVLFENAYEALRNDSESTVFELSTMFLSIRNIATCYSLAVQKKANFGRDAAIRLDSLSVPLSADAYSILRRARLLSTRGTGAYVTRRESQPVLKECQAVLIWMDRISKKAIGDG